MNTELINETQKAIEDLKFEIIEKQRILNTLEKEYQELTNEEDDE